MIRLHRWLIMVQDAIFVPGSLPRVQNGWAEDKNIEPGYQDTWRKPYQSYTARCPQKMMKNITSFHPKCSELEERKKKKERRLTVLVFCWGVGGLKSARRWEENERDYLNKPPPSAVGADYWRPWCSHRFHEANIKAGQLEEKAEGHTRTDAGKENEKST